jgi:hypothetical protein
MNSGTLGACMIEGRISPVKTRPSFPQKFGNKPLIHDDAVAINHRVVRQTSYSAASFNAFKTGATA